MNLLCFDFSSGGVTATIFNSRLESTRIAEHRWNLQPDERGAATLSAETALAGFKSAIRELQLDATQIDAISIGTFLHSLILVDADNVPLTPVFTWLDSRGQEGLDFVRSRLGEEFHARTGCRYHPMFPVFKLAAMRLDDPNLIKRARKIVSIKALLLHELTGTWIEDDGIASASGLFNIKERNWDGELLNVLGLDGAQLPDIQGRTEFAGTVASASASAFGLPQGVRVIVGSGDGFLANIGSTCEGPSRIAITLGTSAVARQTISHSVLDFAAGTFCYRADANDFLLGCAGSNGGNVLDWGRQIFGSLDINVSTDPPIFIPLLHGERSPEWDPHLTASWHFVKAHHTSVDLSRSIVEGVVFNLAYFLEIIQQASEEKAADIVLSGNGFLYPATASLLATVAGINTWTPNAPGLASLRGAAICALRALGQPSPALELTRVSVLNDATLLERYSEYRRLRALRL